MTSNLMVQAERDIRNVSALALSKVTVLTLDKLERCKLMISDVMW